MTDTYKRRRFIEMVVAGLASGHAASQNSNRPVKPRDVVNYAGELWDEIEHQCPENDREDD